jgi:hypothetical protein
MANKRSAGRPHGGDLFRDEVNSVLADLQGLAEELTPGVSVSTAQPDAEEWADAHAEVGAEQSVTAIEAAEPLPTEAQTEPAPNTASEPAEPPPAQVQTEPAPDAAAEPAEPLPAQAQMEPAPEAAAEPAEPPPAQAQMEPAPDAAAEPAEPPPAQAQTEPAPDAAAEPAEPLPEGTRLDVVPVAESEPVEQPTVDTPEADAERAEPSPPAPWSTLPPAAPPPAESFWTPGERPPLPTPAPWPAEVMPTPAPPPMPARELIPAAGSEFPLDGGEPRRPPLPPPLFQEESTAGWRLRTLAAPGSVETATRAPTPEESLSAMEDAWPLELDIKLLQPPAQPAPSPTDEPANPAHGPAPAPDGDGTSLLPAGEERPRAWGTRRPSMTTVIASGFPPDGPRPGLLPSGGAAETTLVSIQPWTMAAAMAPLVPLTPPPARPGGAPHVDAPGTELSASHIGTSRPPAALLAVGTALLLVLVAVILFIRLHLHV